MLQTAPKRTDFAGMIASPVDEPTKKLFRDRFDRAPFLFRHQLANHELFKFENLRALAMRMNPQGRVYYDTGNVRVSQKWGKIAVRNSLEEALDQMSSADAWVILKSANKDPEYSPLLDLCIAELSNLTGRNLDKEIKVRIMSIVISSPGRITPYHMDGECNFLLQSQGSKTIYVFDGKDRSIVTDPEIERFWNSDKNAAQYKESAQPKAIDFELSPGVGVHVPLLFPHWVRNGPEVSVSVSMNFEFADTRLPEVYRANYYLRKLGLDPTPPGRNRILDDMKRYGFRALETVRRSVPRAREVQ